MYAYAADTWCDDCAEDIAARLDAAGLINGVDPDDGDTDSYPQGYGGSTESDSPQHCAGCGEFLENDLTVDGEDYVRDAVLEDLEAGDMDSIAVKEWMPYYSYIDYGPKGFCATCGDWADLDDFDECEDCVGPSPVEGDFSISPAGRLGGKSALGRVDGKFVGEFGSDDEAAAAARAVMEDAQTWVDVWLVSDHGNWSLYTFDQGVTERPDCDDCRFEWDVTCDRLECRF